MENVPEIPGTIVLAGIGCWFLYAVTVQWFEFRQGKATKKYLEKL